MIQCEICKQTMNVITWKHLRKHGLTVEQYKQQYPNSKLISDQALAIKKQSATIANSARKGVPRTVDVKLKISQTKKAKNIVPWNKGLKLTEQQKQLLSQKRKLLFKTGSLKHWNTGNITPDHVKQKISKTLKSQQRKYSHRSLLLRKQTYLLKKQQGWIHPSTLRAGTRLQLSDEARQRIRQASYRNNQKRILKKINRIATYLMQHNIIVEKTDLNNYLFYLQCRNCNTSFTRTVSVLAPCRYAIYQGQYCPTCYPTYTGYYSEQYFADNPQQKQVPAILYVAQLNNENERFLKIGITTRSPYYRLASEISYDFNILLQLQMPLYKAFVVEQQVLQKCIKQRYFPRKPLGGKTECLQIDINNIEALIKQTMIEQSIPIRIVATGAEI